MLFSLQQELHQEYPSVDYKSDLQSRLPLEKEIILKQIITMILLSQISPNEYIFLACPFREISNTANLADVLQQWRTETKSSVFAISFT